jgi:hypothetical protein
MGRKDVGERTNEAHTRPGDAANILRAARRVSHTAVVAVVAVAAVAAANAVAAASASAT